MAERKAISKKVRFEVFKRDNFTCQYCGKSAPDVVLEIDHMKPVSKGGTNDITNLITACFDCNRGKSNKELSDDSVIKKQNAQLQELAKRREQIEMMMLWREELKDETEMLVNTVADSFESLTDRHVTEQGRKAIRKWLKQFSINEILDAIEVVTDYYAPEEAFGKISGTCYITRKQKNNNDKRYYYANYLLKAMRGDWYYYDTSKVRKFVFDCLKDDEDFERAKYCLNARNWTQFKSLVYDEFEYMI